MKDVISTVFLNYFLCVIIGGILEYVAPAKSRKTLKICILCVMLLSFLTPLLETEIELDSLYKSDEQQVQEKYNSIMHTANMMEKELYSQAKEILINLKVSEYEIYIDTSYNEEENTVYLDGITVELGEDYGALKDDVFNSFPDEYKEILLVGVKNE